MMESSKSTKRALISSALAILMCVAMLIGTTFAWFTDTASTGVNKIQAGNLDVKLMMLKGSSWVSAEGGTLTFKTKDGRAADKILWEPGCTYELPALRIDNCGNLALKYKIIISGIKGDAKLNEAIEWKIADGLAMSGNFMKLREVSMEDASMEGVLYPSPMSPGYPNATNAFVISGHMKEDAGNEYQGLSIEGISITVVATQATYEEDSFGNTYDKDATYPVTDNKGLKDAINNAVDGSTVHIASGEYTLSDPAETSKIEIPAGATIAGAGADNTTLNVNNDKIAKDNVTLKDMTIKGSGSQGTGGTLNVNGNNTTIENIDYKGDGNIAIAVSTGGSNSGTTFRGTKITNAFRGIQFWSLSGNSVIDNCVLDVAGYTFNIDAAVAGSTLTITNSTLNGWTSYTSGIDLVTFDSCKLGLNAYSYLRPYSETMLVNCEFTSDGYQLNAGGSDAYTITLTNCTKNGTLITADNVKALLLDTEDWNSNATLIVNGVTVSV